MAAGALTQQAAQVTGLVVLLAVVTVLARRLSLAELGTYGLTARWPPTCWCSRTPSAAPPSG